MHAEDAYLFRHALLRDAAYQMQMPGDRAKLHELALVVLERVLGITGSRSTPTPFSEELALHAAQAADPNLRPREMEYRLGAGAYAASEYHYHSALRHLRAVAESSAALNVRSEAVHQAAAAANYCGRHELSYSLLQEFAEAANALGGKAAQCRGEALSQLGRSDEAEAAYRDALAAFDREGEPHDAAIARNSLGFLMYQLGRRDEAVGLLNESLQWFAQHGPRLREGMVRGNLALVARAADDLDGAAREFRDLAALFAAEDAPVFEGNMWANLAGVERRAGDPEAAERAFARSLQAFERAGHSVLRVRVMGERVNLLTDLGRYAESVSELENALDLLAEQPNDPVLGMVLQYGVVALTATGRLRAAEVANTRAAALHRASGNRLYQAINLNSSGELALLAAEYGDAEHAFGEAEQAFAALGSREFATVYGSLGILRAAAASKKVTRAAEVAAEIERTMPELSSDDRSEIARAGTVARRILEEPHNLCFGRFADELTPALRVALLARHGRDELYSRNPELLAEIEAVPPGTPVPDWQGEAILTDR